MSLRYHIRPHDPNPTGKFQHRRRPGTVPGGGRRYRDWSFQLIEHHTGTTVRRTVYNVAITDPRRHRVAYLPGFATSDAATAAAHRWIDARSGARLSSVSS